MWHTKSIFPAITETRLCFIANTMAANHLKTGGTRAMAVMLLIYISRNIPTSPPEDEIIF